ncbi:MAG: M23 family metallopeptidase [Lachnospiraceae bacterium]|nr:M23 family metallopeptidase [Lachnospiraceae bacterium]
MFTLNDKLPASTYIIYVEVFMRGQFKFILSILCVIFFEAFSLAGMQYFLLRKSGEYQAIGKKREEYSNQILSDIKCFPIPISYREEISYEDTYGVARENGGHDGCDIMDKENEAGRIPVVSATDGVITNIGWLYLGGYRIGVTSECGIYYYYAHLDSYAAGITAGKKVAAGELLGFMGNTGEGEEGTVGKFPVHLHFAIYIYDQNGNEETVNSYLYLRKIDEE